MMSATTLGRPPSLLFYSGTIQGQYKDVAQVPTSEVACIMVMALKGIQLLHKGLFKRIVIIQVYWQKDWFSCESQTHRKYVKTKDQLFSYNLYLEARR